MIEDIHAGQGPGDHLLEVGPTGPESQLTAGPSVGCFSNPSSSTFQSYQRAYYPTDNVLMMNLEFGMANQFILDSERQHQAGPTGQESSRGWFPQKPPIGYLPNKHKLPDLPPIIPGPGKIRIVVKRLWLTLIDQRLCSVESLYDRAVEMGLKTPNGKTPFADAVLYAVSEPLLLWFNFLWKGDIHPGKHDPMISKNPVRRGPTHS
jgi:hypothetical protein